ncbi:MAG TPA: carboxymuconolactone decarboxylase family protein [Gemmatimonadaceae bacterium]|nr:carboxymuconolactone decarboxylase family protein [Gemmatimonadaceae bacterium]
MNSNTEHETPFSESMRALIRIAAAVAGAPLAFTRRVMVEAVGVAPARAVDEVLLQSYLFAGFPRTLNALRVWREVSGEPAPADDVATTPSLPEVYRLQGEEVCRTVYGNKYDALRKTVGRLHPALDAWMVMDGYGKVLSRPGLTLVQRELCIVAACAASEQIPQLKSHLHGALHCGATPDDLALTLSALTDIVSREALAAAREELNRIKES